MRLPLLRAKELARAGLVAGLLLSGWSGGWAQEPTSSPPPPPAAPTMSEAPAGVTPGSDSGCAGEPGSCGEKSFDWSKVPPVQPMPRLGNYYILPTGPGYYSLWDCLTDTYREKPPPRPWPPQSIDADSFFNNDFRYLDKPDNTEHDWLDCLKRIHLSDNWLFSLGGEERIRYVNEVDSRLSGKNNTYELLRSRVYGDLWYRDLFRVYVEYLDAHSYNQDLVPLPIDVNKSDLLNLFVDLKVAELDDHPVYLRGGRQELLYGSERLISPLDWANTRRTFEGVKGFWHSDKLDVDAFWVRPVVPDPGRFDSVNDKVSFAGWWNTYRPMTGQAIDLYYLYEDSSLPVINRPFPEGRGGFDVNTFGTRYSGDYKLLLWDFEGMYQFGERGNQPSSAGAATTGLGLHFADVPMNPHVWIYNDFASGDHNPGRGHYYGTFNQLFPFGHYYFGFVDVVGRQNIDDLNLHCYFFPAKWITTGFQYHVFRLDSAKDALYNAAGAPLRRDPTGRAGTNVGDEIDYTTNFHLSMHQDILVGYSHLYSGDFIKRTGSPLSPDYFYLQYTYRW